MFFLHLITNRTKESNSVHDKEKENETPCLRQSDLIQMSQPPSWKNEDSLLNN